MAVFRYGIFRVQLDISLVCRAHSRDIKLNTLIEIPFLRAHVYYPIYKRGSCTDGISGEKMFNRYLGWGLPPGTVNTPSFKLSIEIG